MEWRKKTAGKCQKSLHLAVPEGFVFKRLFREKLRVSCTLIGSSVYRGLVPRFVRWRLLRNVPRRWRFRCRAGSARTRPVAIVYGWLKLHALFYAGVSPKKLAAIYAAQASRKQTKQRAN
jgi:hypothetical protein